jgi:hypothetical protein
MKQQKYVVLKIIFIFFMYLFISRQAWSLYYDKGESKLPLIKLSSKEQLTIFKLISYPESNIKNRKITAKKLKLNYGIVAYIESDYYERGKIYKRYYETQCTTLENKWHCATPSDIIKIRKTIKIEIEDKIPSTQILRVIDYIVKSGRSDFSSTEGETYLLRREEEHYLLKKYTLGGLCRSYLHIVPTNHGDFLPLKNFDTGCE